MNLPHRRLVLLIGLVPVLGMWIGGCSLFPSTHESDGAAASHMEAAEGYEQAGDLGNATREYAIVASTYTKYDGYPKALWKAASLYLNERNPAANDSSALSMLTLYVSLPGTETDKTDARMRLSLVERIVDLKNVLSRTERSVDSLGQVAKKQATALTAQTQRLSELETEVRQTKNELARLKDVDVRLSRLHRRR